jgi:hypothetical protein
MRVDVGMRRGIGKGANKSRIKMLLRKAATSATERYGIGGRLKTQRQPKPITLPKLQCLEPDK